MCMLLNVMPLSAFGVLGLPTPTVEIPAALACRWLAVTPAFRQSSTANGKYRTAIGGLEADPKMPLPPDVDGTPSAVTPELRGAG